MLIKYHGKICNIVDTLEKGEIELDKLTSEENIEDTIQIPSERLEDAKHISLEEINKQSEDIKDVQ